MKNLFKLLFLILAWNAALAQTSDCTTGTSRGLLEGENFRVQFLNAGDMFWSGQNAPGYEWPKNSNKYFLFGSALWFGGIDSANNKVVSSVQTYRQGGLRTYWPGPLVSNAAPTTNSSQCKFWNRHFSMSRNSLHDFLVALQANPAPLLATQIPEEVRMWPGKSNTFLKQMAQDSGLTD